MMDTRKWDLDYDARFGAVDVEPAAAEPGFRTEMTWQNTASTTFVQVAVPETIDEGDIAVVFEAKRLSIELGGVGEGGGNVALELGHPSVRPDECTWGLGVASFGGEDRRAVKCALEKKKSGPWDEIAFGATVQQCVGAAYYDESARKVAISGARIACTHCRRETKKRCRVVCVCTEVVYCSSGCSRADRDHECVGPVRRREGEVEPTLRLACR